MNRRTGPRKRRAAIRSRKLSGRFVAWGVLLACMVLGGRAVASALLVRPVRVEEGTVEQSIVGEAFVIRDEESFAGPAGVELRALVKEGDRVRVGTPIMQAEDDAVARDTKTLLNEVEAELASWRAQNQAKIASLAQQMSSCRSKVDDLIGQVTMSLSAGDSPRARGLEDAISEELSRHESITGEYDAILANGMRLMEQKASIERALSSAAIRASATIPGIVSFKVDGLETYLATSPLSQLTPRALRVAEQSKPRLPASTCYKIVRSGDAVIGVICSAEDAIRVVRKEALEVRIGEKSYRARVKQLSQQDPPGFVTVFLEAPDAAQSLIDARRVEAEIVLGRRSGVVVPKNCLVRRDGVTGVFVIRKTIARFQPVEILGELPGKGVLVSDLPPGQYVARNPWLVKEGQVIR